MNLLFVRIRKQLLLSALAVSATVFMAQAQVNVGSSTAPQAGAALQVTGGGTKGLLGPKVALTSLTVYAPITGSATDGMLVFHDGSNNITAGYYYWSENKWNFTKSTIATAQGTNSILQLISTKAAENLDAGHSTDLFGYSPTITLSAPANVLITYSALPVPAVLNNPTQGVINLLIDGTLAVSSYYSASDGNPNSGANALVRLGNYSTSQYVVSLSAGTHTINVTAKCWAHSTRFNVVPIGSTDPSVNDTYLGASTTDDAKSMKTRLSALIIAQ